MDSASQIQFRKFHIELQGDRYARHMLEAQEQRLSRIAREILPDCIAKLLEKLERRPKVREFPIIRTRIELNPNDYGDEAFAWLWADKLIKALLDETSIKEVAFNSDLLGRSMKEGRQVLFTPGEKNKLLKRASLRIFLKGKQFNIFEKLQDVDLKSWKSEIESGLMLSLQSRLRMILKPKMDAWRQSWSIESDDFEKDFFLALENVSQAKDWQNLWISWDLRIQFSLLLFLKIYNRKGSQISKVDFREIFDNSRILCVHFTEAGNYLGDQHRLKFSDNLSAANEKRLSYGATRGLIYENEILEKQRKQADESGNTSSPDARKHGQLYPQIASKLAQQRPSAMEANPSQELLKELQSFSWFRENRRPRNVEFFQTLLHSLAYSSFSLSPEDFSDLDIRFLQELNFHQKVILDLWVKYHPLWKARPSFRGDLHELAQRVSLCIQEWSLDASLYSMQEQNLRRGKRPWLSQREVDELREVVWFQERRWPRIAEIQNNLKQQPLAKQHPTDILNVKKHDKPEFVIVDFVKCTVFGPSRGYSQEAEVDSLQWANYLKQALDCPEDLYARWKALKAILSLLEKQQAVRSNPLVINSKVTLLLECLSRGGVEFLTGNLKSSWSAWENYVRNLMNIGDAPWAGILAAGHEILRMSALEDLTWFREQRMPTLEDLRESVRFLELRVFSDFQNKRKEELVDCMVDDDMDLQRRQAFFISLQLLHELDCLRENGYGGICGYWQSLEVADQQELLEQAKSILLRLKKFSNDRNSQSFSLSKNWGSSSSRTRENVRDEGYEQLRKIKKYLEQELLRYSHDEDVKSLFAEFGALVSKVDSNPQQRIGQHKRQENSHSNSLPGSCAKHVDAAKFSAKEVVPQEHNQARSTRDHDDYHKVGNLRKTLKKCDVQNKNQREFGEGVKSDSQQFCSPIVNALTKFSSKDDFRRYIIECKKASGNLEEFMSKILPEERIPLSLAILGLFPLENFHKPEDLRQAEASVFNGVLLALVKEDVSKENGVLKELLTQSWITECRRPDVCELVLLTESFLEDYAQAMDHVLDKQINRSIKVPGNLLESSIMNHEDHGFFCHASGLALLHPWMIPASQDLRMKIADSLDELQERMMRRWLWATVCDSRTPQKWLGDTAVRFFAGAPLEENLQMNSWECPFNLELLQETAHKLLRSFADLVPGLQKHTDATLRHYFILRYGQIHKSEQGVTKIDMHRGGLDMLLDESTLPFGAIHLPWTGLIEIGFSNSEQS